MPIRIATLDEQVLGEVRYLNASRGGKPEVVRLPILRATLTVEGPLGHELDAIVACSDLQGIVRGPRDEALLLGVHLAEVLEEMAFDGVIPACARTGAILAGDLYSVPGANKRGGYGDVADVWRAFAERFAWVAGVAGNHDDVDGVAGDNVHLLDGEVAELDGLRIGGVGGIISEKQRPWRRPEAEQLKLVDRVIDTGVDVLVLHEGPPGDDDQWGNAALRATIEAGGVGFTVCGHSHWDEPLAACGEGQVLNVDARVVVITAGRGTAAER